MTRHARSIIAVSCFALAGCSLVPIPGSAAAEPAGPTPAVAVVPPAAEFPSVHAILDAADALARTDPGAAIERYRQARVELLRRWGELRGGDLPNNRLMRSFGHIDSEHEGHEALSLLWRSFLGRTAALVAAGRGAEALGELPGYSMWKRDCPADQRAACVAHLAWIEAQFPGATTKATNGKLYTQVAWRVDREPNDLDTQKGLFELPTLVPQLRQQGHVLVEMTASRVERDKAGRIVLRLEGIGIGIRTGSNCRKELRYDRGERETTLVDRCDRTSHEKLRPPSFKVIAAAPPDLPPAQWGDAYLVLVDGAKLAKRGATFVATDATILSVRGKRGMRYWFGVNLDWSLPEPGE